MKIKSDFVKDTSDPSTLIMRNPYQSMSGSKKSCNFGQNQYHYPYVPQFLQIKDSHQTHQQSNFQMTQQNLMDSRTYDKIDSHHQNMHQFKNPNYNSSQNNNESTKNHKNKNLEPPTYQNEQIYYPQRLTFQRQNNRLHPNIIKNLQDQQRHSFNPLQNRLNQMEKMYKVLYQIISQNRQKQQAQAESMNRIERKLNQVLYLLQKNQSNNSKNSVKQQRHHKDSSKTQKYYQQTINKKIKVQQNPYEQQNSSEQLSRYLQPTSLLKNNLNIDQQRTYYNGSKSISSNHTKRVKPFIVNSQLHNQSSIPYNIQNTTIQFGENCQEDNKQNINISNLTSKNSIMKKKNRAKTHQTNAKCYGLRDQIKSKQLNQAVQKQVKQQGPKNRKHIASSIKKSRKSNIKQKAINQTDNNKLRVRCKSQKLAKRKNQLNFQNHKNQPHIKRSQFIQSNQQQPQYYLYTTSENQTQDKKRNLSKSLMKSNKILQNNSQIFKCVQVDPKSYSKKNKNIEKYFLQNEQQNQKYQQMNKNKNKQKVKSTQLYKNMSLLESIEQKRRKIDEQLEKRLMKNSSILYTASSNVLDNRKRV